MIDLRSDTVTRPTAAMRTAMARAEVGDDGYREDPTVRELEQEVAGLFGHEAALFVPSGHMANLTAVAAQTDPGDLILLDDMSHIVRSERGWPERLVRLRTHVGPESAAAEAAVCCIEQTQGNRGGLVLPLEAIEQQRSRARRLHCDGARVWNAAVAAGLAVDEYGSRVDSISVCFSKGLGAPVGSAVVSDGETIDRAREWRLLLGGRMRQAGVLAAAALYAVRHHRSRLAADHEHAALLGDALRDWLVAPVETNIVMLEVPDPREFVARAAEKGVLVRAFGEAQVRLVTHLDLAADQVRRAAAVLPGLMR